MPRRGENIRKRRDGRWEGRFRYTDEAGRCKYKSVYAKSYKEVKERLIQTSQKTKALTSRESLSISFLEIMEKWLDYVKQNRKYSTYMKYMSIYERYIKDQMRNVTISEISDSCVKEKIFSGKKSAFSDSMKHSILAVINQALKYGGEYGEIPMLRLKNISLKENRKAVEIIKISDQSKLISYLYSNLDVSRAGILLCISTGLRLGEICSLKWEDIDLEQMIIHVNKTVQRIAVKNKATKTELFITLPKSEFSVREIPISNEIKRILMAIRVPKNGYFLSGDKPMEPRTYQNHFKKYLSEIHLKNYNFHAIRHTFATNCIDNGMDVKSLSEILGHSDVQITLNRYVHPTMDTKRRHINALSSIYGQYYGQENTSLFIN